VAVETHGVRYVLKDRKFESDMKRVKKSADMTGTLRANVVSFDAFLNIAGRTLRVLQNVARGITTVTKSTIDAASSVEQYEFRLKALTGSQEKANQKMKDYTELAGQVPITLEAIIEAGVGLEAFGADSDKWLNPLTDLSFVMGVKLPEAAQALGRAYAGGAGAADIFRERGILQIIKDAKGIEDLSKLTLPEFREAMFDAFVDPSGKVAGAARDAADTWVGGLSMVEDAMFNLRKEVGQNVIENEELNALIKDFTEFLKDPATIEAVTGFAGDVGSITMSMVNLARDTLTAYGVLKDFILGAEELNLILPKSQAEFDKLIVQTKKIASDMAMARISEEEGQKALENLGEEFAKLNADFIRATGLKQITEEMGKIVGKSGAYQTTFFNAFATIRFGAQAAVSEIETLTWAQEKAIANSKLIMSDQVGPSQDDLFETTEGEAESDRRGGLAGMDEGQALEIERQWALQEELTAILAEHESMRSAIIQRNLEQRIADELAYKKDTLNLTQDLFGALSNLTATGSEKMFKVSKGFAIAEATMSTYQAAANALATKPFFPNGLLALGVALTQGFAQVKAIKGTSPGGGSGGGGGTSSGGGVSSPTPRESGQRMAITPPQEAEERRSVGLTVNIENVHGNADAAWVRDSLAPELKKVLTDGVDLGVVLNFR